MNIERKRLTIERAELVDPRSTGEGRVELYLRQGTATWLVILPAYEIDPTAPPGDGGHPERVRRPTPTSDGL